MKCERTYNRDKRQWAEDRRTEDRKRDDREFRELLDRTTTEIEAKGEIDKAENNPNGVIHSNSPEEVRLSEGTVLAEHDFFWRLEDLKLVRVKNERAFFRLETNLDARMIPLGRFGNREEPVKVLNISAGGVGIGTRYQCCVRDKLLLKMCLLSEEEEENLLCQVLRVEQKGISGYVYGCRFLELSEKEQEDMMGKILELERRIRGME